MLPQLVQYFYDVENAISKGENIQTFGFNEFEISVEEIMVSLKV